MAKFFEFFSGKKKRKRRPKSQPQSEETRQLQRQLERGAQDVSLSRLKKQGLNRLKVINANTIKGIVNDAVDEAIRLRDVSLTRDEREQIQDMARAQLGEVLEENRRLTERVGEASTRAVEFETLVASLGQELREQQEQLEAERSKQVRVEVAEESFAELERRLKLTFERLVRDRELLRGTSGEELSLHLEPLETELDAAITRLVSEARSKEQDGHHEDRAARIELLERRIKKLDQALVEAETNLQRVAMGEQGVASIYADVQGLSPDDPQFKKKGGLLGEIFLQNLQLQGVETLPEDEELAKPPVPKPEPKFPPTPPLPDVGVAF